MSPFRPRGSVRRPPPGDAGGRREPATALDHPWGYFFTYAAMVSVRSAWLSSASLGPIDGVHLLTADLPLFAQRRRDQGDVAGRQPQGGGSRRSSPLVSVLSTRICLAGVSMNWVKRERVGHHLHERPFDRIALRTFRWFSVRASSLGNPRRSRTYQRAASPEADVPDRERVAVAAEGGPVLDGDALQVLRKVDEALEVDHGHVVDLGRR